MNLFSKVFACVDGKVTRLLFYEKEDFGGISLVAVHVFMCWLSHSTVLCNNTY